MTFQAGKELGHYRIVRKLGAGGMADVYEAQDLKLGRTVALKILPPEVMRNPEMVGRFQTEVRAVASLNHRSIVTVFDVGMADGVHFYSMRLLTGGDLRGRIRKGALRAIEALAILRELTGAFEHAHGKGFVHRDVKPENVLFDDEGLPLLTDFGIAKALGSSTSLTATGVAIGTPRYFSPEQARGKPVDARSDLYSLGIILHEMLTGKPPYDGEDPLAIVMKHVNDPIPLLPDEHAQLQPLLELLLAKDPAHRIASAKELRGQISGLGGFASLTPQPINLGDESELVQRLLSGEGAAYKTPASGNPTVVTAAPRAPTATAPRTTPASGRPGGGSAAAKRPLPPKAQVEQIIPYRARPTQPETKPSRGLLKPLVAVALLGVAVLAWFPNLREQALEQALDWANRIQLALASRPEPPASKASPPKATASPAATPAPASAQPPANTKPAVATPAPTPAPAAQRAPTPIQKPATTGAEQPKPATAPTPDKQDAVTPAPAPVPQAATPKPEPAPQPTATTAPAPAPVEPPVAVKPQPAPAPASVPPAASAAPAQATPANAEAEASSEEDDLVRQRAEQLKLERERREAARKKAEDAQQQQQPPQAPAEGEAPKPAESPPPQ